MHIIKLRVKVYWMESLVCYSSFYRVLSICGMDPCNHPHAHIGHGQNTVCSFIVYFVFFKMLCFVFRFDQIVNSW